MNGSSSACSTCLATASAAMRGSVSRSVSRIRNSSPPWRASRSVERTTPRRRTAIRRSSSSPAAWPSESLTALKSSRSTYSSATACPERRARARPEREVLVEQRAVRQLRQRVVVGEERDLLLRAAALGDVAEGGHRAVRARLAVAHRADGWRPTPTPRCRPRARSSTRRRAAAGRSAARAGRASPRASSGAPSSFSDLHRPLAGGAVEEVLLGQAEDPRRGRVAARARARRRRRSAAPPPARARRRGCAPRSRPARPRRSAWR